MNRKWVKTQTLLSQSELKVRKRFVPKGSLQIQSSFTSMFRTQSISLILIKWQLFATNPFDSKERNDWMTKLSQIRRNGLFVDSNIITSDFQKFPIDRNVFAAVSPYFMALYSNSLYSENKNREVFLPDISSKVMEIIVEFVYTGELNGLTESNLESVIKAVNRLQITGALDYCYQFWIRTLNVENCISISSIF